MCKLIIFTVVFIFSRMAMGAPDEQADVRFPILITGNLPSNVNAVIFAIWSTNSDIIFCKHYAGIETGFVSKIFPQEIPLFGINKNAHFWKMWWDEKKSGFCDWRLTAIEAYISSGEGKNLFPPKGQNIPSAIGYPTGNYSSNKFIENKKEIEYSVILECNFSKATKLITGESINPCPFVERSAPEKSANSNFNSIYFPQKNITFTIIEDK